MSSASPRLDVPQRVSLSARTADALRKAIHDSTWEEFLPSERRLCELAQVSRPTVRAALRLLAHDGLLEIRQGCRIRILRKPRRSPAVPSRLIGLFTPAPVSQLSFGTFQGITDVRAKLSDRGFSTEIVVCPPGSPLLHRRKLEAFTRSHRLACAVLLSVSHDIQHWFEQQDIPALVLGSCHHGVQLPSLDFDNRSICRHAAGTLLGKGHRRIALVILDSNVAGDLASEAGFREAARHPSVRDAADFSIVRHNGTAQNISTKLDALFGGPRAPTALLVAKPQHVFIVLMYLLKRGIAVPDQVSLIARDYDHHYATVSPAISHYAISEDTYALRLSRLVQQLVNREPLSAEPHLIFPKFFPGGTIKHLP